MIKGLAVGDWCSNRGVFAMLSVRQDLGAANHCFSFSSPPPCVMDDSSNEFEFAAWTETIRGGPWNRGVLRNYGNNPSSHELGWLANDGDSTFASPPSGENADSSMEDSDDQQKHLCSDSRAQTIARHGQEMLNMVDDIPESIFELSMRDLMELPKIASSTQENPGERKEDKFLSVEKQKKAEKGMKRGSRSESMDNGLFLLKVFFPVSLGGRRKSSSMSDSSLPKPMLTDGEKGMLEKHTDGKWRKENELSYFSQNNGTNSRRRRKNGCYSFFQSSKSKN